MRVTFRLVAALAVAAGFAIPVVASAATAQAVTTVVGLPITQYSHMVVDPVHQLLFITSGASSDSILVTDYSGQMVTTIPNEPGATGLALSSDGSTVYAALAGADAISAISTSTLAETARYSTGAGTGPPYVAYASGKIWFGYNGATPGNGGIGSIDPSTSPATITLRATPDFWYSAPMVTAGPNGELVAGQPQQSPIQLASYDVSSGTATVLAPQQFVLSADNLNSFHITPDGADVVTASGAPYYQQVFSVSSLAPTGTYPTTSYPNSVSISSDGSVAAGTSSGTNAIFIFAPNSTTPVNTFNFGSNWLAADGAALTPDGSELFAITLQGGPTGIPQLNIIPDPLRPPSPTDPTATAISGHCSSDTLAIGETTTCTAYVTDTSFSGGTTPTGTVSLTSDTSGGTFADGGSCTLVAIGAGQASCSLSYSPGQVGSGTQTITASYNGDSGHDASSGQAVLTVTPRATSLSLSCSPATIALGQATSCTASVTDTSSGGATTPTGTVSFINGTHKGNFTEVGTCTLSAIGVGQASCSLSFSTPPQLPFGTQAVAATYSGDSEHALSGNEVFITVIRATSTNLTCREGLPPVLSLCTATVTDISPGTATAPAGTVSFTSSGPGHLSAAQCTLSASGTSASCTVAYWTPEGIPFAGQIVTASYAGDATHQVSTGSMTLN